MMIPVAPVAAITTLAIAVVAVLIAYENRDKYHLVVGFAAIALVFALLAVMIAVRA